MESDRVVAGRSENPTDAECLIESVETPAKAVLEAISSIKNRPIDQLECLYEAIDPDALNTLIDDRSNPRVAVHFEYEGCSVEVTGKRVRVTETNPV